MWRKGGGQGKKGDSPCKPRRHVPLAERLQEQHEDLLDGITHAVPVVPGIPRKGLRALEGVAVRVDELEREVEGEEELKGGCGWARACGRGRACGGRGRLGGWRGWVGLAFGKGEREERTSKSITLLRTIHELPALALLPPQLQLQLP